MPTIQTTSSVVIEEPKLGTRWIYTNQDGEREFELVRTHPGYATTPSHFGPHYVLELRRDTRKFHHPKKYVQEVALGWFGLTAVRPA